jgi:hypothetical protein
MIIGIDFDGTICEHEYPGIGKLLPKASEVINKIHEFHKIIIITCRHTSQDIGNMVMFLKAHNIPYDLINENDPELIEQMGDCRKVHADVYIDDHNLGGFSGWEDVDEMFEELGYYDEYQEDLDDYLFVSEDTEGIK